MTDDETRTEVLSPWWRYTVLLVILSCFAVLTWLACRAYESAPPIPDKIVTVQGNILFSREDILAGQQVFLRYGLMENGSIWGHGAYLGPDFSAEYLHTLAVDTGDHLAQLIYGRPLSQLSTVEAAAVTAEIVTLLKENRYLPELDTLFLTIPEAVSYRNQLIKWTDYFREPRVNRGLLMNHIGSSEEIRQLTAFFAWTAWASVARRPGKPYSYTNNFPYDPMAGNGPTADAILWSALSLITLLAGTAAVLFAFGRFHFLGWKGRGSISIRSFSPVRHRTASGRRSSTSPLLCFSSFFRSWPGAPPPTIGPTPAVSTASISRATFRAMSSGPGTSNWPSSGSPRPSSRAGCFFPRPWEEKSRAGRPGG